ncbi:MAG: glycosyltransferase [Flavobacterium psychrophilum]|nr:MAG: glycosyltransferase [Flavobacterium psychrophilum]
MSYKKRILVAPLNWGLGHATRCIPVIEALENHGYEPVIASDGIALALLKKEFPHLTALELPHYHIEYAKRGVFFKLKIIRLLPQMLQAIRAEKRIIRNIIKEHAIKGIISDNRLGARSKAIPSVFLTHQLNVLTGTTTWITTPLHRRFIKKYNECWVPDVEHAPNLSGKLGHSEENNLKLKYIGPLSRLHKKPIAKKYDLMVILSGTEPQRRMLEEKLREELKNYSGKILFVRGVVEADEEIIQEGNITFYNFMNSAALEDAFNQSEVILCRSGYSTIMDLAQMGRKAFFIPTPGRYEQEYLAKKLKKSGLVPYATQSDFKISDLRKADHYKGLKHIAGDMKWKDLFCLFEGK